MGVLQSGESVLNSDCRITLVYCVPCSRRENTKTYRSYNNLLLCMVWSRRSGKVRYSDCFGRKSWASSRSRHNLLIKCYSWKKWRDSMLCAEKLRIFQVLQQRLQMCGPATTNVYVFVKWSSWLVIKHLSSLGDRLFASPSSSWTDALRWQPNRHPAPTAQCSRLKNQLFLQMGPLTARGDKNKHVPRFPE